VQTPAAAPAMPGVAYATKAKGQRTTRRGPNLQSAPNALARLGGTGNQAPGEEPGMAGGLFKKTTRDT